MFTSKNLDEFKNIAKKFWHKFYGYKTLIIIKRKKLRDIIYMKQKNNILNIEIKKILKLRINLIFENNI